MRARSLVAVILGLAGLGLPACVAPPARRAVEAVTSDVLGQLAERRVIVAAAGTSPSPPADPAPPGGAAWSGPGAGVSGTTPARPPLAVVGGVRRIGTPRPDDPGDLAAVLEHELVVAFHPHLRLVEHRDMESALDVLRIQASDLYSHDESVRRLGEFLQADLFVTGSWVPRKEGELELTLRVLDIRTLELLATARAPSRGRWLTAADTGLEIGRWITVPLPGLWDMLVTAADASFDEREPTVLETLGNVLVFPIHLVVSPFLSRWEASRWWLGREAAAPAATAPGRREDEPGEMPEPDDAASPSALFGDTPPLPGTTAAR